MYGYALMFFFLVSLFGIATKSIQDASESRYEQQVQSLAENVSAYMRYAKAYKNNNPSYSGAVSDAAMGLPSWFGKQEAMSAVVSGGRAYVYLTGVQRAQLTDSANYIRDRTKLSSYGFKSGGQVVSIDGNAYAIPAQVPEGAFVFVM